MSAEAAREFITRADYDPRITQRARDRFEDVETVGREHGYDFTRDEIDHAMRHRKASGHPLSGGTSEDAYDGLRHSTQCECAVDDD